ncbi:WhiB family transcriptional regulator [Prescottella soli]|uniref:Transcriptional regulator WhiB n=1 Tax=Prescottella soli TaxID=1543852 RepID=A0ABW9FRJ0_9NOCA
MDHLRRGRRDSGNPQAGGLGWRLHARCRHTVEHLFFPPDNERHGAQVRREAAAKEICADCPVIIDCRHDASTQPELVGVWGALTERDRSSRRLRATAAAS